MIHKCERCESVRGIELEPGRTVYHFEGVEGSPDDPNRDVALCRSCAETHHDHWDAMWTEYNQGRL